MTSCVLGGNAPHSYRIPFLPIRTCGSYLRGSDDTFQFKSKRERENGPKLKWTRREGGEGGWLGDRFLNQDSNYHDVGRVARMPEKSVSLRERANPPLPSFHSRQVWSDVGKESPARVVTYLSLSLSTSPSKRFNRSRVRGQAGR